MRNWIAEWVETLRIAPPFSKRRRDLLAAIAEADADRNDPDAWHEVHDPLANICLACEAEAACRQFADIEPDEWDVVRLRGKRVSGEPDRDW